MARNDPVYDRVFSECMARKPTSVDEVRQQVHGRTISTAEYLVLTGSGVVPRESYVSWDDLAKADLSDSQRWVVTLREEETILLIDTEGYDYPRYAGIIHRCNDDLLSAI